MVLGYGFITIPFTLFVADHTRAAAFVFAKEVIDVDDVLNWPQWVDRLAAQLPLLRKRPATTVFSPKFR